MDTSIVLCSIMTFIILALIVAAIYLRYKNSPKQEDKEAAKKFLDGLKDTLYNMMLSIIRETDYSQYETFTDLESAIMLKINESCQKYIESELEKSTDALSVLALKALKTGMIDEFIEFIISNFNVEDTMRTHFNSIYQENLDESVKEDEKLQEEFSNEEEYYAKEESSVEELDKVDEEEIINENEKHISELNPVREEGEEPYNPDDDSMEILDEGDDGEETENISEDEEDDIFFDSNGRARSKATGRFIKTNISTPRKDIEEE